MPRIQTLKACNYCGQDFIGGRLAKYCSDACRQATHYYCTHLGTHKKCKNCGAVFEPDRKNGVHCEACR